MGEKLNEAIAMAAQAHDGQFDRAGEPYILHPLRIMLAMGTEAERIVAVLHDVVEDGDVGLGDILALFGEDVRAGVDAVTRRAGESYPDFIERAKANPIGRAVKLADIRDNLAPWRSGSLTDSLRERYEAARLALKEGSAGKDQP